MPLCMIWTTSESQSPGDKAGQLLWAAGDRGAGRTSGFLRGQNLGWRARNLHVERELKEERSPEKREVIMTSKEPAFPGREGV